MRVFFLRNRVGTPVACIASEKVDDGTIKFALSTWNPKDKFSKSTAKAVAEGRLVSGKECFVVRAEPKHVKKLVLELIAKEPKVRTAQRVREAAKLRLEIIKLRVQELANRV